PLGGDAVPPTFKGCGEIADVGAKSLTISWEAATDDFSAPGDIQYEIYSAFSAGGQDFAAPPLATVKGATSIELKSLDAGKTYHFVCRARDPGGNVDANTNEKSATTSSDVTAPAFNGLAGAVVDGL